MEDGSRRSSEHHAHLLLAQMNKMRLHSELCDVRLLVGGRAFQVHRLVLAASGPYFSALFNSAMSEAREEEVHIAGVEADVFESLLEFIYTGRYKCAQADIQIDTRVNTEINTQGGIQVDGQVSKWVDPQVYTQVIHR